MAKVSINTLRNWFKNGLKPTQEHFWNWQDSYWHKDEKIPMGAIEGLNSAIAEKADAEQLTNHVNDTGAHGIPELKTELKNQIADKTDKGGYEGTSKDLKDGIDANKTAINEYTPPEYGMSLIENQLALLKDDQEKDVVDLSVYLDNLPRIVSGSLDTETGIAIFTRDDETTFEVNLSGLKDEFTVPTLQQVSDAGKVTQNDLRSYGGFWAYKNAYEITKYLPGFISFDNKNKGEASVTFHTNQNGTTGTDAMRLRKTSNDGLTFHAIYVNAVKDDTRAAVEIRIGDVTTYYDNDYRTKAFGRLSIDHPLNENDAVTKKHFEDNSTLEEVTKRGNTTKAGTETSPPIIIPTGTLTTVPQNGAIERDSVGLHHVMNNSRKRLLDEGDTENFITTTYKSKYRDFMITRTGLQKNEAYNQKYELPNRSFWLPGPRGQLYNMNLGFYFFTKISNISSGKIAPSKLIHTIYLKIETPNASFSSNSIVKRVPVIQVDYGIADSDVYYHVRKTLIIPITYENTNTKYEHISYQELHFNNSGDIVNTIDRKRYTYIDGVMQYLDDVTFSLEYESEVEFTDATNVNTNNARVDSKMYPDYMNIQKMTF